MTKENNQESWSKEECRRMYVYNLEPIGIRELVKKSNRNYSLLASWSTKDGWVEQRTRYQSKLRTEIEEKTITKQSQLLSDSLATVAKRHYEGYKVFSDLAVTYGRLQHRLLLEAEGKGFDDAYNMLRRINPTEINFWSLVLDRSFKGESQSVGLKQEIDPNAAIQTLEKMGYEIREKTYIKELEAEMERLNDSDNSEE